MIPSDPNAVKKMQELAERNIANGDWGDEVTIPGLGETVPISSEEREAKRTVSEVLSEKGDKTLPKRK